MRTETGASPYSTTALDRDALHAWVMVRPGKVVAVSNVHLSSGSDEAAMRLAEAEPLAALGRLAADGTPVFLTGDFNSSSHLDLPTPTPRGAGDRPARPRRHAPARRCRPARQLPRGAPGRCRASRATRSRPARRIRRRRPERARRSASTTCSRPGAARRSRRRSSARPTARSPTSPSSPGRRTIARVVSTFRVVPVDAPALIAATPRLVRRAQRRIGAHLGSVRPGLDGARGPARRRAGGCADRRARHAARLAAHDPALDDRPCARRLRRTPRRRGRRRAPAQRVHDRDAGRAARDRGRHRFDAGRRADPRALAARARRSARLDRPVSRRRNRRFAVPRLHLYGSGLRGRSRASSPTRPTAGSRRASTSCGCCTTSPTSCSRKTGVALLP